MSGRLATWLAAAGCAVALAGCGGGSETTSSEPSIPAPLADDLASQSDAIAASLESGDVCGAARQADALNDSVNDGVANGQIPRALQGELQNVVAELVNGVNCPPPEEEEDEENGKGKGKGKDKDEDESVPATTTMVLGTTTE
ncbi:MAG: hypothetical protein WD027_10560 [Gaiellales bacterium]